MGGSVGVIPELAQGSSYFKCIGMVSTSDLCFMFYSPSVVIGKQVATGGKLCFSLTVKVEMTLPGLAITRQSSVQV